MTQPQWQPTKCPKCGSVDLKIYITIDQNWKQYESGIRYLGLLPVEQEKAAYYCLDCAHEWEQWPSFPE